MNCVQKDMKSILNYQGLSFQIHRVQLRLSDSLVFL